VLSAPNALQWDGGPGHYEVYYLTLTDPATGVGFWIRYTMVAPRAGGDSRPSEQPTAALWFLAMDPRPGRTPRFGRKLTLPIDQLRAETEPFRLSIGDATLSDSGMQGSFEDVAWDLSWTPATHGYEHVHRSLRRAGVAKTVLVLPHADLEIDGTVSFAGEKLEIAGAKGGQAHLWGSKHASSWAWVHCNDFFDLAGERVADTFIDAVSVFVPRFGREVGPNTPVVGRVDGEDFISTAPLRVARNTSTFALTGWRFEAIAGKRKLIGEVDADRDQLAGVTYHDPDGDLAYCYNAETASMRLHVYEKARQVGGWAHTRTLVSNGRTHFEYAQRTPIEGMELFTK
jgi:hypothetical protein